MNQRVIENRALQEEHVRNRTNEELRNDVYEVLQVANEAASRLKNSPTEKDQNTQDLALRCCFFLLNTIGDRRLKDADMQPEEAREAVFREIKDDFELIVKFADNPEYADSYFFKSDADRLFTIAVMAALSFMGGNPGIERVEDGAEQRRMLCFEIMMHALDRAK